MKYPGRILDQALGRFRQNFSSQTKFFGPKSVTQSTKRPEFRHSLTKWDLRNSPQPIDFIVFQPLLDASRNRSEGSRRAEGRSYMDVLK
jgi:hypothetical protein